MKKKILFTILCLLPLLALADAPITNWLQNPATPIAEEVRDNFWFMFCFTVPFLILPQVLLAIAIFRFNEKRGHKPATFHENLKLEIAWTVIPVLTLITISIPAFHNLKSIEVPPKSDLVIEVIGHQFFWEYRFPKYEIAYSDAPLVVPADKIVTLNLTSVDVIHAYWVPAFGIKQDANPGRITHTWFKAKAGKYKGQCAELCGALHGQMFINVTVLPEAEFDEWVKTQQPQTIPAVTDTTKHAEVLTSPESERSRG